MRWWRAREAAVLAAVFASAEAHATCFDGVLNGPESDVDCGGDCPTCERGRSCHVPRDCSSGRCAEWVCEERSYTPGDPVPRGYVVETSNADGAAVARTIGWVSLGIGYGAAYVAALSFPGEESWLYAPVIGPWVEIADRKQSLRGLIALDSFFQTVGAALVVGGTFTRGRILVRDETWASRVHLTPGSVGRSGYGVWLDGAF
jgi:hypothetical protein